MAIKGTRDMQPVRDLDHLESTCRPVVVGAPTGLQQQRQCRLRTARNRDQVTLNRAGAPVNSGSVAIDLRDRGAQYFAAPTCTNDR